MPFSVALTNLTFVTGHHEFVVFLVNFGLLLAYNFLNTNCCLFVSGHSTIVLHLHIKSHVYFLQLLNYWWFCVRPEYTLRQHCPPLNGHKRTITSNPYEISGWSLLLDSIRHVATMRTKHKLSRKQIWHNAATSVTLS